MTRGGARMAARKNFGRSVIGAAFAAVIAIMIGAGRAAAIDPRPAIEIVAPVAGATFQAGQTIQLSVRAAPDLAASRPGVAVLGDGGLGGTTVRGRPLLKGSITIPASLKPGRYKLTAVARGFADKLVSSAPVFVQIEQPPSALLSLLPPPPPMVFEAIGEQLPLRILGNAASGGPINLTGSQNLTLTASDLSVATVAPNAMVTAAGLGQASVRAALNGGSGVIVPIMVLPPALTPSATTMDFAAATIATQSAQQTLTIANSFNYPIKILSVTSAAEFPETDDCVGAPLKAGASCTINLSFMPLGAGARAGVVEIANSAVIAPTRVYLSGAGNSTPGVKARVFPREIFFGVAINRPRIRRVIIRNLGAATLHGYVPDLTAPFNVASGAGMFTLARGKTHVVEVRLQPPLVPAVFVVVPLRSPVLATLMIATDDPAQPSIPVALHGTLR